MVFEPTAEGRRQKAKAKKMTDPIADMLTRIRNAVTARHARVEMTASKLKAEIARILQDEGYIAGFKLVEDGFDILFFCHEFPAWPEIVALARQA